jgi:predicted GH43/DUF377 family glycosyl hydrolase
LKSVGKIGLLSGLLLGLSWACAAESSGILEDKAEWFVAGDSSHASPGLGKDNRVNGWIFFGSEKLTENSGGTSNRWESLPPYIAGVAVDAVSKVARFSAYVPVPAPGGKGEIAGTLTRSGEEGETELLNVCIGKDAPKVLRLAVLVDNLGSADYVARTVTLALNGEVVASLRLQPNGYPDWLFWDLRDLREGAELSLRLDPDKGVAAIGGLVFLSEKSIEAKPAEVTAPLPVITSRPGHAVGEFSREGEYVKDYYVFLEGDTFHLFYNVGKAAKDQQWFEPGNEKAFGHATSKDLKTWQHHPRILDAVPQSWEGMVVSAPSIIQNDGLYYMFYTGFDDRVPGKQTVGLATSKDLFEWKRHPGNPVYEAPEWAERRPDGWIDCRDSHVIRYGDEFLLFTMVTTKEGKGAIALASSKNLSEWKDLGPAVVTFKEPESPRVFEHGGSFYMFISSAHGKQLLRTTDPKKGPWEQIPFRWPAPGLWSGWEVMGQGDRTIFSAFEWKSFGNFIRFWEVKWKDGVPTVVY